MDNAIRTAPLGEIDVQGVARAERRKPDISLVETPPPGLRARRLLQEARRASVEQIAALESALASARQLSDDIVEAGDLYAPGLHAFAERLGEELFWRSKTLSALALKQQALVG